ncbi:hypothetical protein ACOSQ2_018493 [Xanthoceras sorbifolium]
MERKEFEGNENFNGAMRNSENGYVVHKSVLGLVGDDISVIQGVDAVIDNNTLGNECEGVKRGMIVDTEQGQGVVQSWLPPPPGVFKLNVDAAAIKDGKQICTGSVVRNANGELVLAAATVFRGGFGVDVAEALAILDGVNLATSRVWTEAQSPTAENRVIEDQNCQKANPASSKSFSYDFVSIKRQHCKGPISIRRIHNGKSFLIYMSLHRFRAVFAPLYGGKSVG